MPDTHGSPLTSRAAGPDEQQRRASPSTEKASSDRRSRLKYSSCHYCCWCGGGHRRPSSTASDKGVHLRDGGFGSVRFAKNVGSRTSRRPSSSSSSSHNCPSSSSDDNQRQKSDSIYSSTVYHQPASAVLRLFYATALLVLLLQLTLILLIIFSASSVESITSTLLGRGDPLRRSTADNGRAFATPRLLLVLNGNDTVNAKDSRPALTTDGRTFSSETQRLIAERNESDEAPAGHVNRDHSRNARELPREEAVRPPVKRHNELLSAAEQHYLQTMVLNVLFSLQKNILNFTSVSLDSDSGPNYYDDDVYDYGSGDGNGVSTTSKPFRFAADVIAAAVTRPPMMADDDMSMESFMNSFHNAPSATASLYAASDADAVASYWSVVTSSTTITAADTKGHFIPVFEMVLGAVTYLVIIAMTVIGNILVIMAVFTYRPLKKVQNYFLVSLAASDLAVALIVMPLHVVKFLADGRWLLGVTMCQVFTTADILLCTSSIWNLCAIALDRYFAIHNPIDYAQKRTPRFVCTVIAVVWLVSLLISVPPIIGWNDWSSQKLMDHCELTTEKAFVVYSASGSFFVPLAVMVVVYLKIFISARQRIRTNRGRSALLRIGQYPNPDSSELIVPKCTLTPMITATTTSVAHMLHKPAASSAAAKCRSNSNNNSSKNNSFKNNGHILPHMFTRNPQQQQPPSSAITRKRQKRSMSALTLAAFGGGAQRFSSGSRRTRSNSSTAFGRSIGVQIGSGSSVGGSAVARLLNAAATASSGTFKGTPIVCNSDAVHCNGDADHRNGGNCGGGGATATALATTVVVVSEAADNDEANLPNRLTKVKCDGGMRNNNNNSLFIANDAPSAFMPSIGESMLSDETTTTTTTTTKSDEGAPPRPCTPIPASMGARFSDSRASQETKTTNGGVVEEQLKYREKISVAKEKRAAKTIAVIIFVFTFCWMPFFCVYVILPFCESCYLHPKVNQAVTWLGYINSSLNPFLYGILNMEFRRAFRKILCPKRFLNAQQRRSVVTAK